MEFRDYDFTRNPVVDNEVFLVESKYASYGFSMLLRSIEEVVVLEQSRGLVQVCGPLSGTYKLEIIALQPTAYSVSISGRSKAVLGTTAFSTPIRPFVSEDSSLVT